MSKSEVVEVRNIFGKGVEIWIKHLYSLLDLSWPRILESFIQGLLGDTRWQPVLVIGAYSRDTYKGRGGGRGSERTSDRTLWTRDHANELGLPLSKLQPVRHFGRTLHRTRNNYRSPDALPSPPLIHPGIHCPFDIMLIAPNRTNFRQSTNFCPLNERPLSFPPGFDVRLRVWQS